MASGGFLDSLLNRPAGRLPVSTYFGYGVGQIGGQVLRDTPALILPIYMASVIGLNPAYGGLVILIAKTWAVFADPTVGIISDKTNTSMGRRRPFILGGGLLAAISFFFLFFGPETDSQIVLFLYMTAIYLVLNTGYSMFSVPYLTMATEMSKDPDERTTILSFRNSFLAIGLLVAGALSFQVVGYAMANFGTDFRGGYEWMGIVLGGIIAISTLCVFFGTAKAPRYESDSQSIPLTEQFKIARKNKPFMTLMAANVVQYTSAGIGYAGSPIFLAYCVGLGDRLMDVVSMWIIIMAVTSIASMPVFVWASEKWGKLNVYKTCLVMFSLTTPVYFLADADTLWPVWAASVFIGFFNSGFILMSFSCLTDTVAYDKQVSGHSREGALSSVYSAIDKACNALGSTLFMFFIGLIGFVTTSDGSFAEQSPDVLRNVALFFVLGPAILHSASILILNKYTLTKDELVAAPAE